MTEFRFLNGGDMVVKLNGEVLGGVKKAVCRKNNTINKIMEFLNETPVASFAESSYVVELEMNLLMPQCRSVIWRRVAHGLHFSSLWLRL